MYTYRQGFYTQSTACGPSIVCGTYIGQPFTVLRVIEEPDDQHDEEMLPMFEIQFEDGQTFEAFADEVLEPVEGSVLHQLAG